MTVLLALLAALLASALLLETWLLVHLRRQGAELDRRSAELQRRVALHQKYVARRRQGASSFPAGLPAQSILNDFEFPLLGGGNMTFSQWRGTRIAVVFVQPGCPYSRSVIDAIGGRVPEDLQPIFVSTGDEEVNRALFSEFPAEIPILLQVEVELARVWRVMASPSAYIVDPLGVTEGPLSEGESDVRVALQLPADVGVADGPGTTSLDSMNSRYPRLPENGASVPNLDVALLSGETTRVHSTTPTLLLTFDPKCGPCRELLPELARRAAASVGLLRLLILSLGEIAAATELAKALGPFASVSHQANGEILRRLGMVQTPSALLIDASGRVSTEPAIGANAILSLIDAITAPAAVFEQAGRAS